MQLEVSQISDVIVIGRPKGVSESPIYTFDDIFGSAQNSSDRTAVFSYSYAMNQLQDRAWFTPIC